MQERVADESEVLSAVVSHALQHGDYSILQWDTSAFIKAVTMHIPPHPYRETKVTAEMSDGSEEVLFHFFPDEICLAPDELIGKTLAGAKILRQRREIAFLMKSAATTEW
jgi:hypothetical protein